MYGVVTTTGFPFGDDWIPNVIDGMYSCMEDFNPKFPLSNIFIDKKTGTFRIELALAGYAKDDLTVTADGKGITVEGKAKTFEKDDNIETIKHNIKSSDFSQFIPVEPEYDLSNTTVSYENGILTIEVPIAEDKKPKVIKIA